MKMNAVLLFPPSGSLEETSTSPPSCSFTYSTEYGDFLLLYSVFFVICSTHFTFSFFFSSSSSSSQALNAASEEFFGVFFSLYAVFSHERPFFGGLWHNWSGRVKVGELKWSYFMNSESFRWYAGWRYAATLPERNTKTPPNKSELADAFLLRSDKRNPPCCQATHLKWMLLREGKKKKKKVPGSLIEAKIRQCNSLDNSGSGSWLGHPSRCVPNGAICFETTVQSATGSYVRPGYMFLLSELWPTRQQDGWDAIRTFFCLQPLCVPSFLKLYSPFETSL